MQEGLRVSNAQAAKILGYKKGKLVCKDTAQALWSSSVLATRRVRGNVAPKKRALGKLPKQQLTPEKVDVVAAHERTMAADSADFQRLYTLSRVATNRQQFEAAVTATAAENPAATTSQGNLMCFDEGSATHEAHPPAYSVFEGARHITPSPLPEFAESREPSRQTCSTHSAAAPDLTGQSESPQVLLRDAMRMIECLTGVVQNTLTSSSAAKSMIRMDLPTYSGYPDLVSANEYLDRMLTYQQATGLSDGEMLERVVPVSLTDQAARSEFRDLDELASEAKRIQADILASRAYKPPPPASQALEPRCAWNGDNFRTRPQGNGLLALSDERSSSGWELFDRTLDPYTYARRAACAADGRDKPNDRPKKSLANAKLSADSKNRAAVRAEKKGAKGKGSPLERPRTPAAEDAAAVEKRNELDRRPCLPTFAAQQPSPYRISRLLPVNYGRQRSFPQGEEALVPQHTTIGPSRKANGRSFEHHQPPAAPNASRAQDQLNDSSSSSHGTPPWPATADDSATTAAEGSDGPLTDTTFLTA
ncbi:hypothetical protein HPB50_026442 [Hyalomma asiaticum]|uniref:Uncharacterized protein n=1 Tax=Hyalomma asiaticum TaxID=266040 RepID=A0ACB7SZ57_HYAAI|nr:hypothetical protein HPB50_026442 [Hyalomma asiaticum]